MRVTAWNNGSHHASGAGYGIKLSVADRDANMDRGWKKITLEFEGSPRTTEVNIDKVSFWNETCRELIDKEIGMWLKSNGLDQWPRGNPPKLRLEAISRGRFKLCR